MQKLHEDMALPMAEKSLPGSYVKNLLLVALDGSTLALQDTPANAKEFGRFSNQNGDSAWPRARFFALVECGTHLIFAARLRGYRGSEMDLAKSLIASLREGMLCMANRLFPGYEIWNQFAVTGACLFWRAKFLLHLVKIETLDDGSYLAKWLPEEERKKGNVAVIVRVIEYKLKDPGVVSDKQEIYRLITTILDPAMATAAAELAALYPQRWEIEISIKEGNSILRKGKIRLRSKIPELVKQEFWGIILAHYLVRKMTAQAALDKKRDPDELSYQGGIEIIKSTLTGPVLNIPR
jgi:hypothetical protein